jgi:hypothetical protein
MSVLDEVLKYYKNTKQTTEDLPRERTGEESELLSDYLLNGNLQTIYDYYVLKEKLDKQWVDRLMYHQLYPF